jgi:inositol oxygenase
MDDTISRDGLQLEMTSDNIDKVNVLKDQLKQQQWDSKSKFDEEKNKDSFRQYETACDRVKNFYKEQHTKQTVAYNLKVRNNLRFRKREEMTIWQAMEKLNTLIDESDPDTRLVVQLQFPYEVEVGSK